MNTHANLNTTEIERAAVAELRAISERAGLAPYEIGVYSRTSPAVVKLAVLAGQLPRRRMTRERLLDFIRLNATTATRADVRSVP